MLLQDKKVIITGAGGGLGRAVAEVFAEQGAVLALTDVSIDLLKEMQASFEERGYSSQAFPLDVSDKLQVEQVVQSVNQKFGGIDCLVNLAGGSLYTPKHLPQITESDWDLVNDVNMKGTFFMCQAVAPIMIQQGGGKIVNMASIGGRLASLVTGVAYAAAKGAVISFTRRLAKELGPHGITVNAIAPGTVLSGARMEAMWADMKPEDREDILRAIPLGRLSSAEDQANGILFLCSHMADYITGTVLDVNGGRYMN